MPHPKTGTFVLILALLLGLQSVTTDLYLPGLPDLTAALNGHMAQAQLTLSALILAFGLGQMVMGPLSDRFGRRPVLLGGLTLYVLAAVSSASATSMTMLIASRAIQGIGLAASVAVGRALVRDLYEPVEGARIMSKGLTGLGILAMASPAVGGLLASHWGWRANLIGTGVVAVAAAVCVWRWLPETLPADRRQALHPANLIKGWIHIASNPTFRAWTLLTTCTYGGLYTFLATSSFVYIQVLGESRVAYGGYLVTASASYIAGTFACRRGITRVGLTRTVALGAYITLFGGLSLAGLSLMGIRSPWALWIPQAIYSFGHGIHQPTGQAGSVAPFPRQAGAASALSGLILASTAFLTGLGLGWAMETRSVLPYTLTVGVFACLTSIVAWTFVQRHGHPTR
jgi:MFS transporter, DHA1 family, multidrug resistance protein